jgi:hypothetical protein
MLVRYCDGETKVWSPVTVPNPEDEDQRHPQRELDYLRRERTTRTNRMRGLLAAVGIGVSGKFLLSEDLDCFVQWDGKPLGANHWHSAGIRCKDVMAAPAADLGWPGHRNRPGRAAIRVPNVQLVAPAVPDQRTITLRFERERAAIHDPRLLALIRSLSVKPYAVEREWDYGTPGQTTCAGRSLSIDRPAPESRIARRVLVLNSRGGSCSSAGHT